VGCTACSRRDRLVCVFLRDSALLAVLPFGSYFGEGGACRGGGRPQFWLSRCHCGLGAFLFADLRPQPAVPRRPISIAYTELPKPEAFGSNALRKKKSTKKRRSSRKRRFRGSQAGALGLGGGRIRLVRRNATQSVQERVLASAAWRYFDLAVRTSVDWLLTRARRRPHEQRKATQATNNS